MLSRLPFDSSRQISSGLALLLVIVLSTLVGWMAISASENIVRNVKNSSLTDIEARPVLTGTDVKN